VVDRLDRVVDLGGVLAADTRLRMLANNLVIVPNSKLAQAIVVNHHLPAQALAVLVEVGVDYASDLAHVEKVVVEVGRAVMAQVAGGVLFADFSARSMPRSLSAPMLGRDVIDIHAKRVLLRQRHRELVGRCGHRLDLDRRPRGQFDRLA
jgi:small-conductance mechanosensitive channel